MSPKWSHSFRFFVQIFVRISQSHMCIIWPTHIALLELIPLLHNIPNCYNMKNHVNSPDGLCKLTQVPNKNVQLLTLRELTDDNKTFVCVHKHKTLTIVSLTAGNISSALCSTILGIPVARECRIFHNLETFFYNTRFLGCKWIDLQES
jgi:hypothetical protein